MYGRFLREGTSLAALVILVQYLQPDVFCLMITKMYHYQQRGLLVTPFARACGPEQRAIDATAAALTHHARQLSTIKIGTSTGCVGL
ncbi:hypothetical protein EV424DRAFT_1389307 [Suillus variegatus]|nr:hypothetical protein EV424DRAFT_1389307 [Suillus variegatus]